MVSMTWNGFTGTIPNSLFNLTSLQHLNLNGNKLWGSLPSNIFLASLQFVAIGSNQISGSIPSTILNNSSLKVIYLSNNNLSGKLPHNLFNCKHLQMLHLSHNRFIGSIPREIGNLTMLKKLYLGYNKFQGAIPYEIGNLHNLEYLNLDYANLSGNIPPAIFNISTIIEVSLTGNLLSGSLPTSLGSVLLKLTGLFLADNFLSGRIPSLLSNATMLSLISLSENSFSGYIPNIFGNSRNLQRLRLGENNLTVDPENSIISSLTNCSIGYLGNLVRLSLAQNEFEGPIPDSFHHLTSLELLDLSKNKLTGVIPNSLKALLYLKYFNVSYNKLKGEIPKGGPFTNFSAQSFMGNKELCGAPQLQFPGCKIGKSPKITKYIVLKYILPAAVATTVVLVFICVLKCKKHNVPRNSEVDKSVPMWRRISYFELKQATNRFNDDNLLGIGSFGKVYKGTLSDGMNVAVKVFNLELEGAIKSFDVECEILCNGRHRNLTKIISSCSNMDFKALVLSYMSNGSLEKWLYSEHHSLSMIQKLNIMIDVAEAMDYMHHGGHIPILHCDLKPSNILLDEDMVAHVTDFGIAKLLSGGDSITQIMTLATMGYMAPEYGLEGSVSRQGDVYSYGILLMETFTQKKPTDRMFVGELSIKHWVEVSYPSSIIDIVDPKLLIEEGDFSVKRNCLSSIMKIALDCTMESPWERTNMKDVLDMLKKIKRIFLC